MARSLRLAYPGVCTGGKTEVEKSATPFPAETIRFSAAKSRISGGISPRRLLNDMPAAPKSSKTKGNKGLQKRCAIKIIDSGPKLT
jgi:hypothetical protein